MRLQTASDLRIQLLNPHLSTVMHNSSTPLHTGNLGYPPTYTQACAQGSQLILACDRGEGLSYAPGQQAYLSVL